MSEIYLNRYFPITFHFFSYIYLMTTQLVHDQFGTIPHWKTRVAVSGAQCQLNNTLECLFRNLSLTLKMFQPYSWCNGEYIQYTIAF